MNFIIENWEAIVSVLLAIHGVAVLIVNLTPTPRDNEALAKLFPVVQFLAGLVTEKAKRPAGGTDEVRTQSGT